MSTHEGNVLRSFIDSLVRGSNKFNDGHEAKRIVGNLEAEVIRLSAENADIRKALSERSNEVPTSPGEYARRRERDARNKRGQE